MFASCGSSPVGFLLKQSHFYAFAFALAGVESHVHWFCVHSSRSECQPFNYEQYRILQVFVEQTMPLGVATLPLELLINVVSFLNFEDFVNLKFTEKALWRILQNESIGREIVKVYRTNDTSPAAAAIDDTS